MVIFPLDLAILVEAEDRILLSSIIDLKHVFHQFAPSFPSLLFICRKIKIANEDAQSS